MPAVGKPIIKAEGPGHYYITNVFFIKDFIKALGTAIKQLNTLSKSVIRESNICASLNVRLVFYEDLKKASLESGFLSHINAVNGNPEPIRYWFH